MRIGSLFSGYGGLDRAVVETLGGTVAWHVEFDKHPSAILAHHYPDVPNYGDVTAVDWAAVEPVDVLTGGFPCQDLSTAGKRRGLRPGTRSGLWEHMAYAIDQLRPSLVVVENVRGLLSAYAHSDVESCPICLGDGPDGALRALGAVVGDLAGLGYECRWGGVRASDAGAPHGRFRVFLVAYPADTDGSKPGPFTGGTSRPMGGGKPRESWSEPGRSAIPTDADREHGDGRGHVGPGRWAEPTDRRGPTPDAASDQHRIDARRVGYAGATSRGDRGEPATLTERGGSGHRDAAGRPVHSSTTIIDFGPYAGAIRRWESVLGRSAPAPTERGRNGPRLSPRFVEWLMGLPDGWVTGVGIPRNAQLKALGNGVVPQQAALALRLILGLPADTATPAVGDMLPTPKATNNENRQSLGYSMNLGQALGVTPLLPTPAVNDMGAGKTVEAWDAWTAAMQAKHGNGNGHGKSLAIEAARLAVTA